MNKKKKDYSECDYPVRDEYEDGIERPVKKTDKKDRWEQDMLNEIIACRRVPEMKNW